MKQEDKERIEKEAEEYSNFRSSYRYKKIKCNSYIAGATSEHTKAWNAAIDACEAIVGLYPCSVEFIHKLEALKKGKTIFFTLPPDVYERD